MKEGYYHTSESVKEYIELAKDVNGAEHIAEIQKYLAENSKLLELGTGPGTDFEILSKTYHVTGSDYSSEFIKHLENKYPKAKLLEVNAAQIPSETIFDGIYSNKVLHHLSDNELESSVKTQHAALTENGLICHTFWKGEGYEIFKGMYVNYHSKAEIKGLFQNHFEIIELTEYAEFEEGDSIRLIARKKQI
ncbi:MAG: class I SAM-dependent methyltransferase [Bacteroidetes bacterium]|nr:class I SAM-dependent methyltransferase [Bacteroidota bacterium]